MSSWNEPQSHAFACGWKDGRGSIQMAWGNEPQSPSAKLSFAFRKFHFPDSEKAGIWGDFPESGTCAPENYFSAEEFITGPLPGCPLGDPAESPSAEEWGRFCREIEGSLEEGRLKKVVPARRQSFALNSALQSRLGMELLPRIFGGSQDGTFRFFLKWNSQWFFGATPEMLFRKTGDEWLFPAIAGTRVLPENADAAEAAGAELLSNQKERNEHELVVRGIKETLATLGLRPESARDPELLKIRGLVHLYTPIRAKDTGLKGETLLGALHPTAAVGGYPQRPAKTFLRHKEPLSRGLFASPLLIKNENEEICLVAIRSGLLEQNSLHLFAGAGYVAGSNAENEWQETGKKMNFLRRLLEEERK